MNGRGGDGSENLLENWGQRKSNRWNDGHRTPGTGSWVGHRKVGAPQQNLCAEIHVHVHHFARTDIYHTAPDCKSDQFNRTDLWKIYCS